MNVGGFGGGWGCGNRFTAASNPWPGPFYFPGNSAKAPPFQLLLEYLCRRTCFQAQGTGMPTLYYYHPATGEYVFSREAERDPVGGRYILPASATLSPPPHTDIHQAAIYCAGSWTVVRDYRGETQVEVATKQLSVVDHIGPLEDGYQLVTEEQAVSMSEHPYYWTEEDGKLMPISPEERAAMDRDMMMADKRRQRAALFAHDG